MRRLLTLLTLTASLGTAAHRAHADSNEVDITAFEYIDVVETSDGSVWKGVVIEQTPNKSYKIATADGSLHVIQATDVVKLTKQKNPSYHAAAAGGPNLDAMQAHPDRNDRLTTTTSSPNGDGLHGAVESGMPAPYAKSGLRIDPEFTTVIPMGVLADAKTDTSIGAGFRVGYEFLFGNFGLTVGEQTRITWWGLHTALPDDKAWTLETLAYSRAALHLGRVAPYALVAAGLDTNYSYSQALDMSQTALGLGIDVGAGVAIAASPNIAIDLGVDFHPGTDALSSAAMSPSSEYLALHLGAQVRL
ncbi:hypothetical protein BH11MYX1_BH11MYX1_03360 [soil metagenome]